MRFIPLIVLCLFTSVTAQFTGDKNKKVYWSNDCAEIRLIPLRDTAAFASVADAEKAGLSKADTCTDPAQAAMFGTTYTAKSLSPRMNKLVEGSVFLDSVKNDLAKYRLKSVRVVGQLGASSSYIGPYYKQDPTFFSFAFLDTMNGFGYFYARKTSIAEQIRAVAMDPDRKGSTLYDCSVRFEGIDTDISTLYGELKDCKFWVRDDQ